MKMVNQYKPWSFQKALVFWWILLFLIQQGERFFLLTDAIQVETPTGKDVGLMFFTGFRADLITSTILIVVLALLAGVIWIFLRFLAKCFDRSISRGNYTTIFMRASVVVCLLLFVFLIVDMGYYGHNQQHLDYVFFEYIENLLQPSQYAVTSNQAAFQTEAELQQTQKWGKRLIGFSVLEAALILSWWLGFSRVVAPVLSRVKSSAPTYAVVGLVLALAMAGTGFSLYGPYAAQRAGIASSRYFTLAQNSFWYAAAVLIETLQSRARQDVQKLLDTMPFEKALRISRNLLHPDGTYPYIQYPFVRKINSSQGLRFDKPANVLLLFVEGLDRRYLGRSIDPKNPDHASLDFLYTSAQDEVAGRNIAQTDGKIRITPFLDRLRDESIYFEKFFANGYPTSRGLFATFCSYYPKFGDPEMRTRHSQDFFCLPSALRQFGYRTEMVIGFNRDDSRHHIGLFMARNGLDRLFDESDFADEKVRMGYGMTDAAILSFMKRRIEVLQKRDQPFLLSGLTLSTHHPYKVPMNHPEVRALQVHRDPYPYVHTLRYFDLVLEEFFGDLQREGMLKDTVVIILGDHGRAFEVGRTDSERQMSFFLAPLFIWADESLLHSGKFRPSVVKEITSQVDIAPTILGINGLNPGVAPFLGRDLSCVVTTPDCLRGNVAFFKSIRHDVVGFVDREGILMHSVRRGTWLDIDHNFQAAGTISWDQNIEVDSRAKSLLALYVSTNVVLEQNRIWSWKTLGKELCGGGCSLELRH